MPRVAWALGIKNVAHTAKVMGITDALPNYPSIALGSVNCTPLEMASAYGTLADRWRSLRSRRHHQGRTTATARRSSRPSPQGKQVIKPQASPTRPPRFSKGVISQGTATRADIGRPAAGKTGTSQNNRDAWFIGYTPQLVTSVWVGYTTGAHDHG